MHFSMMPPAASQHTQNRQAGSAAASQRQLSLLASVLGVLVFFYAGAVPVFAAEEIVSIHQIKNLTHTQALEGRPVRLQGVVLCYDPGWNQLYVCDGHETAYFNPHDFQTLPETGQLVEISGTTAGDNAALINARLTVLGQGTIPAAKPLRLSQLGNDWCEWIETTGRVLLTETSRGRLALLIQEESQNCLVYVMGQQTTNDLKQLLDCKVRIRGINASKTIAGRLDSASVFVPGLDEIKVLERAGAKRAQLPVVSIGSLLNRELGSWTNNLVHLNGLIVSYQPGQSLVVKDPTGVLSARVIQLTQIQADERVDVWGFLEISPDEIFLNNAYFEVVQPPPQNDSTAAAPGPSAQATKLPEVLTQVSDILKLRREEAAQHLPVQLRGVITFADPEWHNGFIQDKTGAIYVDLDQKDVRSGQWVELNGRTSAGGFAPEVLSSAVRVLGMTNLPVPAKVDLEDLASGHLDAHWVEMEGVIRRVRRGDDDQYGHMNLSLMTPKGQFKVIIPGFGDTPSPPELIDALVSVQGACTSELNVRRQLSGITLHAPTLAQVKILEPPPADPFALGTTRIDAVATFDPDRLAGRRVKIKGVVTLRIPGQGFILQDASGGMRVLTRQTNEVYTGDLMEVLGFPVIGDFSPYLEEGSFRRTGTGSLPVPIKTTAEQILLHGTNDSLVVEMKARLLQSVPRSANPQLVLQDGPIIFLAHLETQTPRLEVPAFQSGSLLRLTGVCSIQGGERHEPATFRLLLRQPGDIKLLETAPWWTSRYTFMLAGGMMLTIAVALAWVALLRRQVRTQTNLIRQKLEDEAALEERYLDLFENANDMVYTHDLHGRITTVNKTGERLLQRRRQEILYRNLVDLVVKEQQTAAQQWLEQVIKGAPLPTVEWDFAAASGQRVKLEISTRLIEEEGRIVEVEGIARDITERKRLEREILEISNREQRRIGHDLHDGVCQQLAGIAFMTDTLADRLQEKGVPESSQAERISSLLNTAINQTRGVARGLFPVRLEENGLASALEELAANASELFKISCRFVSEEPPAAVDNEVALHLYYIVLEAVANASKHGKARNVTITLEPAKDRYVLSVQDDGAGFAPRSTPQTGMGIRIIHYRARVIGAILTLQSQPGSGTHVACLFQPVSRELSPAGEPETGP
jgi:PAS domain S-box-containing protein